MASDPTFLRVRAVGPGQRGPGATRAGGFGPAAAAVRHCKLARTTATPQSEARDFKFRGQGSDENLKSLAVRRTAAMTGVLALAGPYCQPECAVSAA